MEARPRTQISRSNDRTTKNDTVLHGGVRHVFFFFFEAATRAHVHGSLPNIDFTVIAGALPQPLISPEKSIYTTLGQHPMCDDVIKVRR